MSLPRAVELNYTREKVERLLRFGSDVNERGWAGNTALIEAAIRGHIEIADLF